jgi:Asp-tRNA(Asn)/Glu-tRNA(Gln) amidotransferase A subunit family amidase
MKMNKEDICYMSACDMKDAIIRQELTSQEITEAIIERIEKINPKINAYCTPTFETAREMAKKADEDVKKGEKLGSLHGIPTSIKDLFLTGGIRTTFGSMIYENNIPENDEVVVIRLKEAGIVLLGKTNTPEFGYAGVTHNFIFGESRNPWNTKRIPGGSTGGGAAAVASGLGPLALGNDGGGSVRIPASCCGVFGYKPSFGRVPLYPRVELHGESYVHIGPISRYVRDAALMLDAIKGPHDGDRYSLPEEKISYLENISKKPEKLKIGYTLDLGYAKVIDPGVERNVINSTEKFEEIGWNVEKVNLKIRKPEMSFYSLYITDYGFDLKPKLKDWREKIDPELIKMIDAGFEYSALEVMRAMSQRTTIYETFYKFFKNYDILITPTIAIPPFELGIMFPPKINGKNVSPTAWMPFTFPFNLTGHPAASIPCGWSNEGLPIGMQVIGNRFNDVLLLQVSQAFEEIAPWQEKRPNFN